MMTYLPKEEGISENIALKGRIGTLHKRTISEEWVFNTVVNAGKGQITGLINQVVTTPFLWAAIGTGAAAPGTTQTALVAEMMRGSATCTRQTTVFTNDTAQWVYTFNAGSAYAIAEAGIFDASGSASGNMLARGTFATVNMASGDSLQITYKIQIT